MTRKTARHAGGDAGTEEARPAEGSNANVNTAWPVEGVVNLVTRMLTALPVEDSARRSAQPTEGVGADETWPTEGDNAMIAAIFTEGVLVVFLAVIDFLESRWSELTFFLHALLALAGSLVGWVL